MYTKPTIIFQSIRGYRFWYILWFLILLSICVFYFYSNEDKSEVVTVKSPHVLCVLVPFRNAFEELMELVPYLSRFLNRQGIRFYITVLNQVDMYRFNRGSLFNAGFKIISNKHPDCDYIALHDVDLSPLNDEISYAYPGDAVYHVSSPALHPWYHYPTYIGGIVLMSNVNYIRINGLSNKFWGWGHEDDELLLRILDKSIKVNRPGKLSTNHTNSFRHIHGLRRRRDFKRCFNQVFNILGIDRQTGLNNVNYRISSSRLVNIDGFPVSVHNINMICNRPVTPWCLC